MPAFGGFIISLFQGVLKMNDNQKDKSGEIEGGHAPTPETELAASEQQFRKVAIWILLVMMIVICASVFYAFARYSKVDQFWVPIAKEHFSAVVGLPMAALAALCIVLILRISSGPIEFEAWGLKFKGASAPIVFWLLCYLVITVSIKMVW
jgi:hypothetical protein